MSYKKMNRSERLLFLIKYLLAELPDGDSVQLPENDGERFRLFRSLVNIRPPKPAEKEFFAVQDEFLRDEIAAAGITDIADLKPIRGNIYLWQGDITTLKCGAVVNAANSAMTGCWQPCHMCIDNAIHTFAGVQLRKECAEIMAAQGFPEPTGQAKITSAYNLPSEYVIHTVGPIVEGSLTEKHCRQLESCYRSCLEIAAENNIDSIAFCCVSTGVFGFPNKKAAEIALKTVENFLKTHEIKVIFNVFLDKDYDIYKKLLLD